MELQPVCACTVKGLRATGAARSAPRRAPRIARLGQKGLSWPLLRGGATQQIEAR
jgi:hypothetical protein